MMIPESFNEKNPIPDSLKLFYEYHSTIMEPWDGPAAMMFSDGRYIGGGADAGEQVIRQWDGVSDRAGEIVPAYGFTQAEREVASAGLIAKAVGERA